MLSVAALHPCDLSVQVHGSDYLRGFAKRNGLRLRFIRKQVYVCSSGLSAIRKVAVRLRQGETTAQEIVSTHLEKVEIARTLFEGVAKIFSLDPRD
jgi:hypothetical protein